MSYRQFEIWHQGNNWRIAVYVIEMNMAAIIARKVAPPRGSARDFAGYEYGYKIDPDRPWPYRQKAGIIMRRWNIGVASIKGPNAWEVAPLFAKAEGLRRALERQVANGYPFNPQPDYERRFKHGKSNRPKKKGDRGAERPDHVSRLLGPARLPPGDRGD